MKASQSQVLIVENERNSCFILGTCLENCDCTAVMVASGSEAIAKITQAQFTLAFIDMDLPDRDGIEVLQELKTIQPSLNVVMIAANSSARAAVLAIKSGAIDYLEKPFTSEMIDSYVARIVKHDPNDINYVNSYHDLTEQAKRLMAQGNFSTAKDWLRKAVANDPAKARAFNLLGVISENEHHLPQAQKFYRAAIALDPTYSAANENLQRTVRWGLSCRKCYPGR